MDYDLSDLTTVENNKKVINAHKDLVAIGGTIVAIPKIEAFRFFDSRNNVSVKLSGEKWLTHSFADRLEYLNAIDKILYFFN